MKIMNIINAMSIISIVKSIRNFSKLFKYIIKRRGPKYELCGVPQVTVLKLIMNSSLKRAHLTPFPPLVKGVFDNNGLTGK